jgi:uncharacterized membrane protein YgaE (UPF0421/DUF939 family)
MSNVTRITLVAVGILIAIFLIVMVFSSTLEPS